MAEPRGIMPALQFGSLAQQREVAITGLWLFLATELLLFGGMFSAYGIYRAAYPDGFAAGASGTELWIGAVNTAVLLSSSAIMALAVARAGQGAGRGVTLLLAATAALGLLFMGLKALEYWLDWQHFDVPGLHFRSGAPQGEALFWILYFCLTGIHALHLTIGILLLLIFAVRARRGAFAAYGVPVEILGLYWHFVDLVWIFLYPLIYLTGRA